MLPQSFPAAVAFLWPAMVSAETARLASAITEDLVALALPEATSAETEVRDWASPNRSLLELPAMRLLDFSSGRGGAPTVICAPFALHPANIADFAPGYSLVEALHRNGISRLFATEWRSATPAMRFFSIDSYLSDLNVAVDEIGEPVDLIGICQGGWLGLLYAARFPKKVRKLVIAGAPIDVSADTSRMAAFAAATPLSLFEQVVKGGDGRVLNRRTFSLWKPQESDAALPVRTLQSGAASLGLVAQRFRDWYCTTVDLPGTYYLQVVDWLFKQNRIARGEFVALGKRIDLAKVRLPVYLLAARDDEYVPPGQVLATAGLLGTPREEIPRVTAPCGHLSLFMGALTLETIWPPIVSWLRAGRSTAGRPAAVAARKPRAPRKRPSAKHWIR